jgi:hypothetical protein
MRFVPPPQINVVRKEDKEAKLLSFIQHDIALRRSGAVPSLPATYVMIARSLESPVARALLASCADAAAYGIRFRMLLLLDDAVAHGLDGTIENYLGMIDARFAVDTRLLDAHELLVLSPTTVWIGDCMRRDPAKRDAYEFYCTDAIEASRSAARSFERMWQVSSPLILRRMPGDLPEASTIAAEAAPASGVEAATRH